MKRRRNPSEIYEQRSAVAKERFAKSLRAYIDRAGLEQSDLAMAVGYKPSTISILLRNPDKVTEAFVRAASVTISDLALEYAAFRAYVDAPFLPQDGAETERLDAEARRQARINAHLDQLAGIMDAINEELRNLPNAQQAAIKGFGRRP